MFNMFSCCASGVEVEQAVEPTGALEEQACAVKEVQANDVCDAVGLECTFRHGDVDVPVTFTRRPLGFTFVNKAPIVVTDVTPVGAAAGVKAGMTLTSVGDVAVGAASGKEYGDVFKALQQAVDRLPLGEA
uniref:PDZ domain-containing protein n=1 Tax=Zooxanthella nutricula TaxID=1333877 RepID=A0A7S2QP61_9DINO